MKATQEQIDRLRKMGYGGGVTQYSPEEIIAEMERWRENDWIPLSGYSATGALIDHMRQWMTGHQRPASKIAP